MTRNQITIKNINDNITHIISLLDQNVTTTPSPEIGKETSQKEDAITISPQTNYGLGMHSKKFLDVKLKNLMTTALKTFQMIAIAPHQHHQLNKPFKKIFNP